MKDDLQKKIIQFQILEANLKALQERADMMTGRIEELEGTKAAIEELKEVKPSNALIPLGSGNFITGKVENTEDVIVGIGGGVAVKKKRDDAVAVLDDNLKESGKILDDLKNQIMGIALQLEKIQEEVERSQK